MWVSRIVHWIRSCPSARVFFFEGFGTAIGELPPYFMARAGNCNISELVPIFLFGGINLARLSGTSVEEEEIEEELESLENTKNAVIIIIIIIIIIKIRGEISA